MLYHNCPDWKPQSAAQDSSLNEFQAVLKHYIRLPMFVFNVQNQIAIHLNGVKVMHFTFYDLLFSQASYARTTK